MVAQPPPQGRLDPLLGLVARATPEAREDPPVHRRPRVDVFQGPVHEAVVDLHPQTPQVMLLLGRPLLGGVLLPEHGLQRLPLLDARDPPQHAEDLRRDLGAAEDERLRSCDVSQGQGEGQCPRGAAPTCGGLRVGLQLQRARHDLFRDLRVSLPVHGEELQGGEGPVEVRLAVVPRGTQPRVLDLVVQLARLGVRTQPEHLLQQADIRCPLLPDRRPQLGQELGGGCLGTQPLQALRRQPALQDVL
mmetsp:Transcript_36334/g.84414  ORF Transcript_36334/g.84414 Transcript_36334/m.84414 type:complete len:247 (-) Transcript_36334:73-813(-)